MKISDLEILDTVLCIYITNILCTFLKLYTISQILVTLFIFIQIYLEYFGYYKNAISLQFWIQIVCYVSDLDQIIYIVEFSIRLLFKTSKFTTFSTNRHYCLNLLTDFLHAFELLWLLPAYRC